jgi:hypothetical protein
LCCRQVQAPGVFLLFALNNVFTRFKKGRMDGLAGVVVACVLVEVPEGDRALNPTVLRAGRA